MSLQNCEIFPNPLCFEVFVGCGLELKGKMLEILKRRLGDERLKSSINGLKAVLEKRKKQSEPKICLFVSLPYNLFVPQGEKSFSPILSFL